MSRKNSKDEEPENDAFVSSRHRIFLKTEQNSHSQEKEHHLPKNCHANRCPAITSFEIDNEAMKTILLFSSVFYLLGLKLGNTIDLLKRTTTPVKKVTSAPVIKPKPTGKSYFLKADGDSPKEQPRRPRPKPLPRNFLERGSSVVWLPSTTSSFRRAP